MMIYKHNILTSNQSSYIYINSIVGPKISHFDFGDEPSNFGDMASVTCLVPSGDLPVEFRWLFNSKPLISYNGVSTSKIGKRRSLLTIEPVNGEHAGNYTCEASNKANSVNLTAKLIVNGKSNSDRLKFK